MRADLQLQIAGTAERIEVSAVRPVIETERSAIDSSTSGDDISKLALNFRATNNTSPIAVATLSQGVQQDRAGSISLASALPFMTSFSVDGISTQRVRYGGPSKDLFPSVESIGEFKVTPANTSAEFMQVTDITSTTKSGTNQVHGTAFWFSQDSALSASSRFTPRDDSGNVIKPDIQANSFGISGGGPIVQNHAFFFATYEGYGGPTKKPSARSCRRMHGVPAICRASPSPILNPATGQPFPNNQIPINAVSARILAAFYARQNQPTGSATSAPNYIINPPGDFTVDGFDGRVDYILSANQKVFGRMTWKNVDDQRPDGRLEHDQGDHFSAPKCASSPASHNWIRRRARQRDSRRLVEHGREGHLHERARGRQALSAALVWSVCPGRRSPAAFRTSSSPTARSSRPAASNPSTSCRGSCRAATR